MIAGHLVALLKLSTRLCGLVSTKINASERQVSFSADEQWINWDLRSVSSTQGLVVFAPWYPSSIPAPFSSSPSDPSFSHFPLKETVLRTNDVSSKGSLALEISLVVGSNAASLDVTFVSGGGLGNSIT